VEDYRLYNLDSKEDEIHELNMICGKLETEKASLAKVCLQQEKSFTVLKEDTLLVETKKRITEELRILKSKVEKKKKKINLQDTSTRGNHTDLIEKRNLLKKMKELIKRRS
jgi:hypothetical protein